MQQSHPFRVDVMSTVTARKREVRL
jgi:hypothetical protein